jgi:hypothetical protein
MHHTVLQAQQMTGHEVELSGLRAMSFYQVSDRRNFTVCKAGTQNPARRGH